nr:type IV pilus biogenesis/stability protein PilW [Virgibacillus halodenitrificans]
MSITSRLNHHARRFTVITALAGLALILSPAVLAMSDTVASGVHELQSRWARIQYKTPEERRVDDFDQLYQRAQALIDAQPGTAELYIWAGIIRSSEAGAKGGLGALSLVKEAKDDLEKALSLDASALDGSAYTSLGALYYQVPGWPIGFGDDDKAKAMLQKGLALNPHGIDPLYFWGDYLHDQGQDAAARQALQRALQAAPRPRREVADQGRREQIHQLLDELD